MAFVSNWTDSQPDRQTDRQTDEQTDKPNDRQKLSGRAAAKQTVRQKG